MGQAQVPVPMATNVYTPGVSNTDTVLAGVSVKALNNSTAPATDPTSAQWYSLNGVPAVKDASGNQSSVRNADPVASDNNLIAWSMDPAGASAGFTLASGFIYYVKLNVTLATTITNVVLPITTAGGTLTSAQNIVALYNAAGTQLSVSADQSGVWTSAGVTSVALGTPQAVAAGFYYVGILSNGTTPITIPSGSALKANNVAVGNTGLTTGTARFLISAGSQTTLPGSVTLGSQSTNVAANLFVAVS